jgi:hypothetical protein
MSDFLKTVKESLTDSGYSFVFQPSVNGTIPDFIVNGPNEANVVVEAKNWSPIKANINRAWNQVNHYKKLKNVDDALIVFSGMKHSDPSERVVSVNDLTKALENIFEKKSPSKNPKNKKDKLKSSTTERKIFPAMPFDPQYDDVYWVAMVPAAESVNAACKRMDKDDFAGDIIQEMKKRIKECVAVIADVSDAKPNVLYEVGFAHALSLPTVHISSTPDVIPFDIQHWNTMIYQKGQTSALKNKLIQRLQVLLK